MNFLDLSDEEFAKLDPSSFETEQKAKADPETADATVEEAGTDKEETQPETAGDSSDSAEEGATESQGEGQGSEEGTADEGGKVPDAADEGQAAGEKKEEVKPEVKSEVQTTDIDYKAQYEKLLAPFVANGREIAVKSVDDAIALMQMGANYNKKMAALKPNLKLMKLLESNGLMSEEKISFLIDLEKKNPEAISKLIKEGNIDPMDLDADKAAGYKPTVRSVDDREIELDQVLEEIQETPTYQRTLSIVSKEWDANSKQVIANSPSLLKVINSHIQSGVYDLISKEMDQQRMFGRLQGVSDIEAYRQVGDAIQARGGFDHLASTGKSQGQQTASAAPIVVQPKPKQVDEEKLKEKRRAASTAKPAASSAGIAKDFNPLALSDEDFSKLIRTNIL